ncbi:VanZ family protein [Candidatus Bipolaricaulota bacterium]
MKQWIWIVLLAVYAAGIGYLSHQSLDVGKPPFPHYDKLFHLAEFGLFMFLAWHATGRRLLAAWILTIAYAVGDELHQAFVPTRESSVLDFLADSVGATLVAVVLTRGKLLWRLFSTRILGMRS